ncbi:class IIb bacteriocin, lactobin A/cerein 7B family [Massilia sp. ST3]|uniref:class IIb bacteriocin, lactobin A/cerein 7B family n=1 Tax=Massilia sp. ST3 TaxID=2824903 RepID=UPI001B8196EB|nr:class IIb bacteriocin, lactobin A/cerein 7B family [Massilia sp. ST3]MBQ5949340.1 class IIb bacteriocin, lactobin A/cerein 7B family [Massilia sp. ST3]
MNKATQANFANQSMCEMTAQEIDAVSGGLAPIVFIAVAAGVYAGYDFVLRYYNQ